LAPPWLLEQTVFLFRFKQLARDKWGGDSTCGCVTGLLHGHSMCNSRIVL
jgi:hypothetical protein